MKNLAVFYHCLFFIGDPPSPLPSALPIIQQQMHVFKAVGLEDACSHLMIGINGGVESLDVACRVIPKKAEFVMHGLQCRNECRTILEVEKFAATHPDWYVLYFHSKGASSLEDSDMRTQWRNCMMTHVVARWRRCVKDLDAGCDAVGCHWLTPPFTPPDQYIFAGNFWFAKSNFLRNLPSIINRDRIRISGIDSIESRFEAEIILGNGPKLPKIRDYHIGWRVGLHHNL